MSRVTGSPLSLAPFLDTRVILVLITQFSVGRSSLGEAIRILRGNSETGCGSGPWRHGGAPRSARGAAHHRHLQERDAAARQEREAQLGIINFLLSNLGLRGPFLWFERARLALPAIIVTNIWRGFPFASLTLLAALQAIPREQYEAAAVDGASSVMQFRFVTLPHLRFALVIIATLDTIWNFKHFDLIQVMTNGGPAGATEVLTTLTYKVSFENFEFGYAAAMGVVMTLVLLAVAIVYVWSIL